MKVWVGYLVPLVDLLVLLILVVFESVPGIHSRASEFCIRFEGSEICSSSLVVLPLIV